MRKALPHATSSVRAGGYRRDQVDHLLEFGLPTRSLTLGEAAVPLVPVVVLGCPLVVVRRRGRVAGKGWVARRHRCSLLDWPLGGASASSTGTGQESKTIALVTMSR